MQRQAAALGRFSLTLALLLAALTANACGETAHDGVLGTVDLGDDFVAPELRLDEEFYYCRIQPEVITEHSCAGGLGSDSGGCHERRSALRLLDTDASPPCDGDGFVVDVIPAAYMSNFEAVRFTVQSDALNSPLYLRPLGRASHPRKIFDESDPAADLILEWITAGAR